MPMPMVFIVGNRVDAVWADVDRNVTPSKSLLLRQWTKKLKVVRKSVPLIGIWTSVTTTRQVISRRSPRLSMIVAPVGWCEYLRQRKIAADALPAPYGEPPWRYPDVRRGVIQESLSLRTLSVMNKPEGSEQASAAINALRCRFSAGGMSTVVYIFVPVTNRWWYRQ